MRIDHLQAFQQRVMLLDFTEPVEDNLNRMLTESKVFGFGVSRTYQPASNTNTHAPDFQESELITNLGESSSSLTSLKIRVPELGGYCIYKFSEYGYHPLKKINIDTTDMNVIEEFVNNFISESDVRTKLTPVGISFPMWIKDRLVEEVHGVSASKLFANTLLNSAWVDTDTLRHFDLINDSEFKSLYYGFKSKGRSVLLELSIYEMATDTHYSSSIYGDDGFRESVLNVKISAYLSGNPQTGIPFALEDITNSYFKSWDALLKSTAEKLNSYEYQKNITKLDEVERELEKEKVLEIHITDTGSNPSKTQIHHLPHNFTSMDQIVSAIDTIANQTELAAVQKKWWQFWKKNNL